MFFPTAQRGWVIAIVISVGLVFLTALLVNQVAFRNRFGNALLKTVVHTVLFGAAGLAWWYYTKRTPTPSVTEFVRTRILDLTLPVAFNLVFVLVLMFLANLISFTNRLRNTVATVLLFAVIFVGAVYGIRAIPFGGNLLDVIFL